MRLTANFKALRVNTTKFKQALHQRLSEALVEGCKTWLRTVIDESTKEGLPVWSAASLATLSPLASYVEMTLATVPVGGAPDRVEIGIANGKADFDPGTKKDGLYTFTYMTTLPHLIINEYNNANDFPAKNGHKFNLRNPGPYHFQQKGERTFREFASNVTLPCWKDILDVVAIG